MTRRPLHRLAFLLVLTALLYGPAIGRATEAPEARTPAAGEAANEPHLALLLPTQSEAFGRAAEAVRAGFFEAWKKQTSRSLPVRLYPVTDDPAYVIGVYRKALAAGARLVVGPLTRNGLAALAGSPSLITVPTLALNAPERATKPTPRLYMLSLQVEAEARQVAQLALSEGRRKAFTVSDATPLARRMREAFIEEFQRGGGHHIADYANTTDAVALDRMKQAAALGVADMVFFAVHAARVRPARSQMAQMTAYGTSQLNPGTSGSASELADVRFVDMPWMVQPDHPAVMIYARAPQRESDDLERLYALGIDAFRITEELLAGRRDIDLDGVTGRLRLGPDGQFRRGLLVTLIDSGRLTVLGESRP
jgi:outer membrane PBP1 activator LpoA protein